MTNRIPILWIVLTLFMTSFLSLESDRTVTEQAIAMEQQDGPWSSAMPISDNQKEETSETDDEQEALVSIDIDLVQTSKTWKLRAHQTNSTHICETLQQPPK